MSTETLLYIVLAFIAALAVAIFFYSVSVKQGKRLRWLLSFLRFVSVFSLLLLLINPKFKQQRVFEEKAALVVAVDNSSSVVNLEQGQNAQAMIEFIKNNEALSERFDIDYFAFGESLQEQDTFGFNESQTNIAKALSSLSEVYKDKNAGYLLITDGNQTFGSDYEFTTRTIKDPIFPVILGDSTVYADLKIQRLNVNRYAYLNNKFPVEAIVVYEGQETVNTRFAITSGNSTLYSEAVRFSAENRSKTFNFTLPANSVGVKLLKAQIQPIPSEKNKVNNTKDFAIEVIDQKTKVAIISDILHPDLGVFKKAIETNQQREADILKPLNVGDLDAYQMIILYQPTTRFNKVFEDINTLGKNYLLVTGPKTDWRFLNRIQPNFTGDVIGQSDDVQPIVNKNYPSFALDEVDFQDFPPLQASFGEVNFLKAYETMLFNSISGVQTNDPLLATIEENDQRTAILFGEGIWRWRAQSYLNDTNFEEFDNFIGKLVQYLATGKKRDRLSVSYDSFYYGGTSVKVSAQYFDKNYVFDDRVSISITVKNQENQQSSTFPMILKSRNYVVDLSTLPAGTYDFTISAEGKNISRSGTFSILEYDVEKQFLNANVSKLRAAANNTNGEALFADEQASLAALLLGDDRFIPIQKSEENVVPLIDWKYLLAIIVLALGMEWFIRKYNGLI